MKRLLVILAALMLTSIVMAEPDDPCAAFAARWLPEYTFYAGEMIENTAILFVEDASGATYLAACTRNGEDWNITLSAPFSGWAAVPDFYQVDEGHLALYFAVPPELRVHEDGDWLDVYIDLTAEGTWRISLVNTGWGVIEFRRQSIYDDCGYEFYGDFTISTDITQVDWSRLPRSVHQAMALLDTSRWMLIAEDCTPVYAEDGSIAWRGASGAPVQVLSMQDHMAEVRFIGREETVLIPESSLIPGSEQVSRYDAWCEDGHLYGVRDIILEADDPVISWYAIAHEAGTAAPFPVAHVEYISLQGWCAQGCCCLLYSEPLGTSGFVPVAQLPSTIK